MMQFKQTYIIVFMFVLTSYSSSQGTEGQKNASCDIVGLISELRQEIQSLRKTVKGQSEAPCFRKKPVTCPTGFTYIPSTNGCYKLETDRLEWEVARVRCKGLHPMAHLVSINNQSELDAVISYLNANFFLVSMRCYAGNPIIWTAGQRTDLSYRSSFVWKLNNDDWDEIKFTAWGRGQPDFSGSREFCIQLGTSYLWNDNQCSMPMCPLCEVELATK